jgi:hypothetical protein
MACGQPASLFGKARHATKLRASFNPTKNRRGLPHRKPVSRACARIKKPISGKPEIGAQFLSFNFPNNLICGITSSDGHVPTPCPGFPAWRQDLATGRPTLAVAAAAGFRYLEQTRP